MYWTLKSIPELADLTQQARKRMWRRNARKAFRHPRIRVNIAILICIWLVPIVAAQIVPVPLHSGVFYWTIVILLPILAYVLSPLVFKQQLIRHTRPYLQEDRAHCCSFCAFVMQDDAINGCPDCGSPIQQASLQQLPLDHENQLNKLRRPVRLTFNLKTMLATTLVICIFSGYIGHRIRDSRQQKSLISKLEREGLSGVSAMFSHGSAISLEAYGRVTNEDLIILRGLPDIALLNLEDTEISDAGLVHFEGLTELRILVLRGCDITDAGLRHLIGLKRLNYLYLDRTLITDDGLKSIEQLTNLKTLCISETLVTEEGITKLHHDLPDVEIDH
jgi:hypothetical protein